MRTSNRDPPGMALTSKCNAVGACHFPNRVMARTASTLSFPLFNSLSLALVSVPILRLLRDISSVSFAFRVPWSFSIFSHLCLPGLPRSLSPIRNIGILLKPSSIRSNLNLQHCNLEISAM